MPVDRDSVDASRGVSKGLSANAPALDIEQVDAILPRARQIHDE